MSTSFSQLESRLVCSLFHLKMACKSNKPTPFEVPQGTTKAMSQPPSLNKNIIKAHHSHPKSKIFPVQTPPSHTIVRPLAMVKRLSIENHTKPTLGDVHINSPTHFHSKQPSYYSLLLYITLCCGTIITISTTRIPSCNNMSSFAPRNNPSKPVVVCRVPTFCPKDDQVMLLHDKSYNKGGYKLEESCNNGMLQGSVRVPRGHGGDGNEVEGLQKDSGRERLKRHREEIAGRVLIPDKWGKEELLKDWIDFSSFDSLLAPNGLASARKALMAEGRRTGSQRMRIESVC